MNTPLVPCAACARHVYADSDACPFCDTPRTPQALAHAPLPRRSRSAMAALGLVLLVPAAAVVARPDEVAAQPHRPRRGPPRVAPATDAGVAHADAGHAHADAGHAHASRHRIDYELNMPHYGLPPD